MYRHEREQAKLAMKAAFADATTHLAKAANPKAAFKRHPVATSGAAAGLGLAAVWFLLPTKSRKEARRLKLLERIAKAEARAGRPTTTAASGNRRALRLLFRLAKPTLIKLLGSIAANMARQAAARQAEAAKAAPSDNAAQEAKEPVDVAEDVT